MNHLRRWPISAIALFPAPYHRHDALLTQCQTFLALRLSLLGRRGAILLRPTLMSGILRVARLIHLDPNVRLELVRLCEFTKLGQKTDFVVHRIHALLLGLKPSLQLIEDQLTLTGNQRAKVVVGDVTLVVTRSLGVDQ
jgi:hypothetical protein